MKGDASGKNCDVRVLIAGGPERFCRLVSAVIEVHPGLKYDLGVTFGPGQR